MEQEIGRNLALELVRVTEAAALTAGRWMGRGQKEAADQAAVDAMRMVLNTIPMDGVVVIGEGAKDKAPMLFEGEHLGCADEPKTDIAVDPIDGTRLLSQGMANSISTVAVSERGSMFESPYVAYMDKIAVGPEAADAVDINASVATNLENVARALSRDVRDLAVVMLDRPRHEQLAQQIREAGARIRFIMDGDVAGAVMAATPGTGIDVLMGIGGLLWLAAILFMDWLAMIYAGPILKWIGTSLQIAAVVLGVAQIALGLQVILHSLAMLSVLRLGPG